MEKLRWLLLVLQMAYSTALLDQIHGCLNHTTEAARNRLKLVYLATPKTGSRHMSELLRTVAEDYYGRPGVHPKTYYKPNKHCNEERPATAALHTRPHTSLLMAALQQTKGVLPTCADSIDHVLEEETRRWEETMARLEEHNVPIVATIRDPIAHSLSLFSQQHGWRNAVPEEFQVQQLSGVHEAGWVGSLRLFLASDYSFNPQTTFLTGKLPQSVLLVGKVAKENQSKDVQSREATKDMQSGRMQLPPCCRPKESMRVTEDDVDALIDRMHQGKLLIGMTEKMSALFRLVTRKLGLGALSETQATRMYAEKPGGAQDRTRCDPGDAECEGKAHKPRDRDQSVKTFNDRLREDEVPEELLVQMRAQTELDRKLYDAVAKYFEWLLSEQQHDEI